jgi:DNA/RNA endonuclease G (NUC1)
MSAMVWCSSPIKMSREAIKSNLKRGSFYLDSNQEVNKLHKKARVEFKTYHVERAGYSSAFSTELKQPKWVYETIDTNSISGNSKRPKKNKFKIDPLIPKEYQATERDYKGSGLSRGHLGACGNYKSSQALMKETFYFSNVSPQDIELNATLINSMEVFARRLTGIFEKVHVVTGPLFLKENSLGSYIGRVTSIGSNCIPVPSHFFKAIFLENKQGEVERVKAFVAPNKPPESKALRDYELSLAKLEKISGIHFANIIQAKGVEIFTEEKENISPVLILSRNPSERGGLRTLKAA